jgi:hypothetical protein
MGTLKASANSISQLGYILFSSTSVSAKTSPSNLLTHFISKKKLR